jgi:hypothetical protein
MATGSNSPPYENATSLTWATISAVLFASSRAQVNQSTVENEFYIVLVLAEKKKKKSCKLNNY